MTESERQRLAERLRLIPRPASRPATPERNSGDVGHADGHVEHDARAWCLPSMDRLADLEGDG